MNTQDKLAEALNRAWNAGFSAASMPSVCKGTRESDVEMILHSHAAEATQPQAQAGEWVMVPREPTPEMWRAGGMWNTECDDESDHPSLTNIWRDMLAASPRQQAADSHQGLLMGTTPDGRPYGLHGTAESVRAVSDMLAISGVSQDVDGARPGIGG